MCDSERKSMCVFGREKKSVCLGEEESVCVWECHVCSKEFVLMLRNVEDV